MGFINEIIPESEKDKLPFKVDTRANGYKPTLWKWTRDRDRSACVVHTSSSNGVDGTPPEDTYVMIWRDNLVSFAGYPTFSKDRRTRNWNIHNLVIPECLAEKEGEVRKLIREALDTIGFLYNRDFLDNVNVEFDAPATITNASSLHGEPRDHR